MVASVVLFLVILMGVAHTEAVVTNEDIRITILQLVNVVRATNEKLEKHEYRDRVVSEQVRKGVVNIDKRIKTLDPLKVTVARLEERLAAVETILMQTNEKEKTQLQMTFEAVIDIQKNLPVVMEEMKNKIISKISDYEPPAQITEPVMSKKDFEKMEKEVMNKIDNVANTIEKIENEVSKVKTDNQKVKDLHNMSSDNLEKLKRHFNDSQQLLNKYDKKLADYNSTTGNKENEKWKLNVIKALDGQKSSVKDILQDLKNLHSQVKQLPQNYALNKLQNSIKNCQDPSIKQALHKIEDKLNKSYNETTKNLNGLTQLTSTLNKNLANTSNALDGQKSSVKDILQDLKNLHSQVKQLPQNDALNKLQNSIKNCQDPSIKQALHKIEDKLNKSYDETTKNLNGLTQLTSTLNKNLANTSNAVNFQKSSAKDILQNIKNVQNQLLKLPQIEGLATSQRETIKKLEITMKNIDILRGNTNNLMEKTNNGLDSQKSNFQEILKIVKNLPNQLHNIPQIDQLAAAQRTAISKLDDTVKNMHGLTKDTATLMKSVANTNSALGVQKSNTKEVLSQIKNVQNQLRKLPQMDELSAGQRTAISKSEDALKNINDLTKITGTLIKSFANTDKALDVQKSNTQEVLSNIKNVQNQLRKLPQMDELSVGQRTAISKLEDTLKNINDLTKITSTLAKSFANTNNALDVQNQLRKLSQMDELSAGQKTAINKLEDTLKNINELTKITSTLTKSFANTNDALDNQKTDVKGIIRNINNLQDKINYLPQKEEVLKKLEEISIGSNSNVSLEDIKEAINEIRDNINKNQNYTSKSLKDITDSTGNWMKNVPTNYAFNGQQSDFKEMLSNLKYLQTKINRLPQEFLDIHQNSTLQLTKLSADVSNCKQQSKDEARHNMESIINHINKTHEDIIENVNDLSDITVTLGQSFVTNYDKIKNEIKGLNRLDQVMINTADSVIDTKRKLEFGMHQILAEVSKYSKETTKQVSNRLDTFKSSILDPDTGLLANVTSKIEDDIQLVWKQMGIMYKQMRSNSDALKQLQNQTDAYITGSLGTMNNMKGKVGQITGRITEVDENITSLLGRLSMVTQEFNKIKTGLSTALEQIKESFHAVQGKIDEELGPHDIDSNEQVPTA
ncbi:uncharacterized protein [Diabrotica undecimpunctata]|uniref:uncharacterized protein isoform X2 n=1 Tax=Diabrotica undecimpunctata TaxID=50387 RepID=UPI003B632FAB